MTMHTTPSDAAPRTPLAAVWLPVALAVTFLTRLPLPIAGKVTPADLRRSMAWYPVVGGLMGLAAWKLFTLAQVAFPPQVAAILIIVLLEMLSGALHLDGLMDTCDGMGSGAPRERALEIMKDSRVGAMGVFGAIAVLLVKWAALAALATGYALPALVIGWAAARALPAWDVYLFRYARAAGTGKAFTESKSIWPALIGLAVVMALAILYRQGHGWLLAPAAMLLPLLMQIGVARKLGGLTGDVYGMGIELAETVALLAACVLAQYSLN